MPDAVEADIGAAVDDAAVVGGIGVAAAMADQAAVGADATGGKQLLLLGRGAAVLRVGDDRHAGRLLRDAGGGEELLLERGDGGRAGRDLDGAGLHAGVVDAVGDLADVKFGDLVDGAGTPVHRQPHLLEIEAGGADDVHAGLFRNLLHHRDVAAELDRAGIDEAAHAVLGAQLHEAPHCLLDEFGAIEFRGRIELGAGESDEQMLVHQRPPEPLDRDRSGHRLHHHGLILPIFVSYEACYYARDARGSAMARAGTCPMRS